MSNNLFKNNNIKTIGDLWDSQIDLEDNYDQMNTPEKVGVVNSYVARCENDKNYNNEKDIIDYFSLRYDVPMDGIPYIGRDQGGTKYNKMAILAMNKIGL